MTCIISLNTADAIYIASDSFYGFPGQRWLVDSKTFEKQGIVFAHGGERRIAQIIQYSANWLPPAEGQDDMDYLVNHVVIGILQALHDCRDEVGNELNWTCFLVYKDHLYELESNLTLVPIKEYASIGTGMDFAIAAMDALEYSALPIEEKLLKSLEITAQHCTSVCAPFRIEKYEKGKLNGRTSEQGLQSSGVRPDLETVCDCNCSGTGCERLGRASSDNRPGENVDSVSDGT